MKHAHSTSARNRRLQDQLLRTAVTHHQSGALDEAEAAYGKVLAVAPGNADAWHLLGVIAHQRGDNDESVRLIGKAIAIAPHSADFLVNLSNAQQALGDAAAAVASLLRALELKPDLVVARNNLGNALVAAGQPKQAIAHLHHAATHGYPTAWINLGSALTALGDYAEAIECHQQALVSAPSADAYFNLGNTLRAAGRHEEAVAAYRNAVALAPNHGHAWNNLGIELGRLGRSGDAIVALRQAREIAPDSAEFHSNLIFMFDYDPSADTAATQAERHRWWQMHVAPHHHPQPVHNNDRDPERPLRIGYVSADLHLHSAALSFGPMLRHFDRGQFEVFCYDNGHHDDTVTQEFRQTATTWRAIDGHDDADVCTRIAADGIDILIDLSAHSAGNRLGIFARRPAPVQITAWGHANGTGMPEMDCLFTDPVTIPQEVRHLYAETLVDLPCTLTYESPGELPPVAPLPYARRGHVTFGCFNRIAKIDASVLGTWGDILRQLPAARMVFKAPELGDAGAREDLLARFLAQGIDAERITLLGKTDQLAHFSAYGEVDICLDPFPHGGGISTFESLWMGVPVVAMLGHTQVGRLAAGICSAIGLADWVAPTRGDYIALAVAKAGNIEGLSMLRAQLRSQLLASAAGNPVRYVQAVESAYRSLWRRWCGRTGGH